MSLGKEMAMWGLDSSQFTQQNHSRDSGRGQRQRPQWGSRKPKNSKYFRQPRKLEGVRPLHPGPRGAWGFVCLRSSVRCRCWWGGARHLGLWLAAGREVGAGPVPGPCPGAAHPCQERLARIWHPAFTRIVHASSRMGACVQVHEPHGCAGAQAGRWGGAQVAVRTRSLAGSGKVCLAAP